MADQTNFWRALAMVGLAVGVGVVGAQALDLHTHQCDRCKHTWRHFGAFNAGELTAHTCPQCGDVQWWKGTDGALRLTPLGPPPREKRFELPPPIGQKWLK